MIILDFFVKVHILIFFMNVLVFLYIIKHPHLLGDPFESLKEIEKTIEKLKQEKNVAYIMFECSIDWMFSTDNTSRFIFSLIMFFIPIINIITLFTNLKLMGKK